MALRRSRGSASSTLAAASKRGRARLLEGDGHVGRAVLQRLEVADGLAELSPGAKVLGRHLEQALHRADRLGAMRRQTAIDRALELRKPFVQWADERGRRDVDVLQFDLGGAQAVDRRHRMTSRPAVPAGTRNKEMPCRSRAAPDVRAETIR